MKKIDFSKVTLLLIKNKNTVVRILLACDKFKGSLDSVGVNTALAKGINSSDTKITTIIHPLADGGDGTLAVLSQSLQIPFTQQATIDPLGRSIMAPFLKDGKTAYFELATASGISLLKKQERNPLRTTTLGTGRMMRTALEMGARDLVLGLGGSCTTEAGLGIAYELGVRFFDKNKKSIIPSGGNLLAIVSIDTRQALEFNSLKILSDVPNPLYGRNGAAYVFGPQKGATDKDVDLLDRGLRQVAELMEESTGRSISALVGGGAAGGIAAGLAGLFDAKITNGFEFIKEQTNLEAAVMQADLVITGEGQLDKTSLDGKVVGGVATLCRKYQKPLIAVVGASKLSKIEKKALGLEEVYTVLEKAGSVDQAIQAAANYLVEIGLEISSSRF